MVVDGAELSAELMATVADECPVAGPEGAGKLVERILNKAGGGRECWGRTYRCRGRNMSLVSFHKREPGKLLSFGDGKR